MLLPCTSPNNDDVIANQASFSPDAPILEISLNVKQQCKQIAKKDMLSWPWRAGIRLSRSELYTVLWLNNMEKSSFYSFEFVCVIFACHSISLTLNCKGPQKQWPRLIPEHGILKLIHENEAPIGLPRIILLVQIQSGPFSWPYNIFWFSAVIWISLNFLQWVVSSWTLMGAP